MTFGKGSYPGLCHPPTCGSTDPSLYGIPHVLISNGHQTNVHNLLVQLYPSAFPDFLAQLRTSRSGVGAFLWDFTKALGLHTRVYLHLSHPGVGAFRWDFTRALYLYTLCFLASAYWILRMVLFELLWPFCMFLSNVLMMYHLIWCLWP